MRVGGSQDELVGAFLPFQNGIKNKIDFWIDFLSILGRFGDPFGDPKLIKMGSKNDQKMRWKKDEEKEG